MTSGDASLGSARARAALPRGERFRDDVPFFSAPALWVGLFALLQIGFIVWVSEGRFYALLVSENARWLHDAHTASKALLIVLAAVLGASVIRSSLRSPAITSRWLRLLLFAINIAAFLILVVALADLPVGAIATEVIASPLLRSYLIAVTTFTVMVLTIVLLVWPRGFRAWRVAIVGGVLALTYQLFNGQLNWLVAGGRGIVEGTAIDLSLWFYSLSGRPLPLVGHDGEHPTLSAPGFGVQIAPNCSGYQGMLSAFVLLGAYILLERRSLYVGRAAVLALLAVGGTFVLNALRIAVLFYIGEEISPEVAVNGFHSQFGTLSLLVVSVIAILLLETPLFRRRGETRSWQAHQVSRDELLRIAILMVPLAIYLLAGMLAGLTVGTFNWLYPVPVLVAMGVLWSLRGPLHEALSARPSLLSIFVGVLTYVVWILLIPPDPERAVLLQSSLAAAPVWMAALWIAFRIFGSSVIVPLIEELAFRGGLMRLVQAVVPPVIGRWSIDILALVLTSVAFGLLHSEILAGVVAGLAFGAVYLWRRVLMDAVVAHAVTNFLICLHVLGLGEWSYW